MGQIVLDLGFKVVDNTQQVFIAFPGRSYRDHRFFSENSIVFADFPLLRPSDNVNKQPDLLQQIVRGSHLDHYYRSAKRADPPSRKLSDYNDYKWGRGRYHSKGIISGLFNRAQAGDLVMVPSAQVDENVLVGEFIDPAGTYIEFTHPELYGDDFVPARRVRWLGKEKRGKLPIAIQKKLPRPNAFHLLEESLRVYIYPIAYGSYIRGGDISSKFEVSGADFSTTNDYFLQQIFNSIAFLTAYLENNPGSSLPAEIGNNLDSLVELLADDAVVPLLSVNVNSPGFMVILSKVTVPLVASAFLALTTFPAEDTWASLNNDTLKIVNSVSPTSDPCSPPVADQVRDQLRLMGFERWREMCRKAQLIRNNTGIKGQSSAEKVP